MRWFVREELLGSNVERKLSTISFLATKISFIGVYGFHEMKEVSWYLFRISMLHEKPYMRFESQN
jgi:hypothetical protein